MGYKTQNSDSLADVEQSGPNQSRLTPKGARTRARIVDAAARLIHRRSVVATTLDDVKAEAEVSGSQLYHYFPDKEALVRAVIDHQTAVIVDNQRQLDLGTIGLAGWYDKVIAHAKTVDGQGGCPLGSLGGQLSEIDPRARPLIADGFAQWSAAIGEGLHVLHDGGHLAAEIDPDDLAVTFLAVLQGGLLLAQVQRDTAPLETAIHTLLSLAGTR